MALTNLQLDQAAAMLRALPPGANPLPLLRAGLPGVTLTRCDTSDLGGAAPFCRVGGFDLFLVETARHCWRIVADPDQAGAILLACP